MRLAVIPLGAVLLLSACAPDPFLEAGRKRNQEISERVMRLAELRATCAGNPEMPARALTPAEATEQTVNIIRLKSLAPDIWPQVPLFNPRVEAMRQACAGDPDNNIPGRPMTVEETNEVLAILYPPMEERLNKNYPVDTFQSYSYTLWDDNLWSEPAYRSDRYWEYERDRRYRDAFRDQERYYRDRDVRRVPDPPRYDQAYRERELQLQRERLAAQRRAEEKAAAERAVRNLGNTYSSGSSYSSADDREREAARQAEEAENRRREAEERAAGEARRQAEADKKRQRQQEAEEREERIRRQIDTVLQRGEENRRRAEEDKRRQEAEWARDREQRAQRQADEARRRAEDDSRRQAQQEARDRQERSRREADEARRRAEDDSRRQAQQEARDREDRARREAEQARRAAQASQALKDRSNPSPVRPD